jgi:hypothetical protein
VLVGVGGTGVLVGVGVGGTGVLVGVGVGGTGVLVGVGRTGVLVGVGVGGTGVLVGVGRTGVLVGVGVGVPVDVDVGRLPLTFVQSTIERATAPGTSLPAPSGIGTGMSVAGQRCAPERAI